MFQEAVSKEEAPRRDTGLLQNTTVRRAYAGARQCCSQSAAAIIAFSGASTHAGLSTNCVAADGSDTSLLLQGGESQDNVLWGITSRLRPSKHPLKAVKKGTELCCCHILNVM
jgi:hypothetical protein